MPVIYFIQTKASKIVKQHRKNMPQLKIKLKSRETNKPNNNILAVKRQLEINKKNASAVLFSNGLFYTSTPKFFRKSIRIFIQLKEKLT